jgi:hypothetical protein
MRLGYFWELHSLGNPLVMLPTLPSPNWNFLLNPWGFTTQALLQDTCFFGTWSPCVSCSWSSSPCVSCVWSSAPWAFYPVPSPPRLWKSIFCLHSASTMMGWTSIGPCGPFLPLDCLTLMLFPQCPCLCCFGHLWTCTISGYIIQASGWYGLHPLRTLLGNDPMPSPNWNFHLTSGALWLMLFPRLLASLGPAPQKLLIQGICPMGCLSPVLTTRPGHPRACNITTPTML